MPTLTIARTCHLIFAPTLIVFLKSHFYIIGGYDCQCPAGFVGPRCEGDVNECLSNPCSSLGTQECIQLVNNYNCVCKAGYMGRHCETKRNFCQGNPCQNGGVCSNQDENHHCTCPPGFIGPNCQFAGTSCDSSPCRNGGTCIDSGDGTEFACLCPAGTTGKTCEQDTRNECTYDPCKHGHCIGKFLFMFFHVNLSITYICILPIDFYYLYFWAHFTK